MAIINEETRNTFMSIVEDENYKGLCYSNERFSIIIPTSLDSMITEAKAIAIGIAHVYIDKVISGTTRIYFMRQNAFPDKPYIAIEVRNGVIRQAYGEYCRKLQPAEVQFLKEWAEAKCISFHAHVSGVPER